MPRRLHILPLCIGLLACPLASQAVVYAFTGVVDSNHTVNPIYSFSSFTGQFSFDTNQPDADPGNTDEGYYPLPNLLYGMQVSFDDGTVFTVDPLAGYSLNVHLPQSTPVGQPPDKGHFTVKGDVAGTNDRFLNLRLEKAFTTDALPSAPGGFTLASFDAALFSYHGLPSPAPLPGQVPPPPFGATGHLTSLQCISGCAPIPEPGSAWLLAAGLGAVVLRLKRISRDPALPPGRAQRAAPSRKQPSRRWRPAT